MRNILFVFALIIWFPVLSAAQGNAFNFQGRLNDGANPANGAYDLKFQLFNAATSGTMIGESLRPNTPLINGVFSVKLDFGSVAFNNPNSVFIEIAVKPNGSPNAYTILGPRQQLTVVPFAVRANNATFADIATTASNAFSLGNVPASSYARLDVVNSGEFRLTGGLSLDGDIILVNFGFSVANRFVSLTAFNDTASVLGFPNGSTVNIDDTTTNGGSSEFFIHIF